VEKKAVLFDFDGVAIKSMEQHYEAWAQAFRDRNVEIERKIFYLQEGQGLRQISKALGEKYGLSKLDLDEIIADKKKYYKKVNRIIFYDGFVELLQTLKIKNIPMGIVTGGNKLRVLPIVQKYYSEYVSALVTFEDTDRGKPYPDPFLRGASLLRIPPEECIVVENAPLGVKAAKRAGMYVIAVETTLSKDYLDEADKVVENFYILREHLENLFNLNVERKVG
jgi:beta-phosphoglucomutase